MEPSPALAAFVERVLQEPALERRLAACRDEASLVRTCEALADERGWQLPAAELPALLQARFQRWHQRHLG